MKTPRNNIAIIGAVVRPRKRACIRNKAPMEAATVGERLSMLPSMCTCGNKLAFFIDLGKTVT